MKCAYLSAEKARSSAPSALVPSSRTSSWTMVSCDPSGAPLLATAPAAAAHRVPPDHCAGSRLVGFDDLTVTENTRCAYPPGDPERQAAGNRLAPDQRRPTHVRQLRRPPAVSKLTPERGALACPPPARPAARPTAAAASPRRRRSPSFLAPQVIYHFVSGFTSKMARTRRASPSRSPRSRRARGEPFLVWTRQARRCWRRSSPTSATAWLLNTGWLGAPAALPAQVLRAIVDAIHRRVAKAPTKVRMRQGSGRGRRPPALPHGAPSPALQVDAHFGLHYPTECAGVPPELLDPASSWADKEGFAATSRELAALFHKNFAEEVRRRRRARRRRRRPRRRPPDRRGRVK